MSHAASRRPKPSQRYNPDEPAKPLPKTNFSDRFAGAKATIDTGMTVPKLVASLKNRMPTGEIFRRIRPKKLVQLLVMHMDELEEKERLARGDQAVEPEVDDQGVPAHHHMHSSLVFDDKRGPAPAALGPGSVDCPFILLDMRDEDEFDKCHIMLARCHPKARLSRATGQFTPEIMSYQDRTDGMVVLYCDYGGVSGEAAQMFAERGFHNVFLLHGGLADFADEYPDIVGPGEPPKSQTPKKKGAGPPKTGTARVAQKGTTRAAQSSSSQPGDKRPWK